MLVLVVPEGLPKSQAQLVGKPADVSVKVIFSLTVGTVVEDVKLEIGAVGTTTVKVPVADPDALVTVTVRSDAAASAAILTEAVILVALSIT
jgi:hypothetical protein